MPARLGILLLLVLAPAAPAQDRIWGEPVALGRPFDTFAIAPDGTVTGSESLSYSENVLRAQAGTGDEVLLSKRGYGQSEVPFPVVAAGVNAVAWMSLPPIGAQPLEPVHTQVSLAGPDGVFAPPEDLGPAGIVTLVGNAAGDLAAVFERRGALMTAFRPVGGTFGPAVPFPGLGDGEFLPGDLRESATLSPSGELLLGVRSLNDGPRAALLYSRVRSGEVEGPDPIGAFSDLFGIRVRADGHGRAVATWWSGDQITVAVRDAAGTWRIAQTFSGRLPSVDTSDAGEAVLIWSSYRDRFTATDLHVATGSLADGAFTETRTLGGFGESFDGAVVDVAPGDGSAIVAVDSREERLLVARRSGTGPFGAWRTAACRRTPAAVGLARDGTATVVTVDAPRSVLRDRPGSRADVACPRRVAQLAVALRWPVAGPPVRLDVSSVLFGETPVEWDMDRDGSYERQTTGTVLVHRFGKPGRQRFAIRAMEPGSRRVPVGIELQREGRVRAAPRRQSLKRARSRGIRISLRPTAYVNGYSGRPVTVTIEQGGHVVGRRRWTRIDSQERIRRIRLTSRAHAGRVVVRVSYSEGDDVLRTSARLF